MAQITINEISANYGYSTGTNSFATVALPITAAWGPGFFASTEELLAMNDEDGKEAKYCNYMSNVGWDRFAATSAGMEAFLRAYRAPTANFKSVQDYSYHQALTLLTAGYDVLVCRISPGQCAHQSYDTFEYDSSNQIDTSTIKRGALSLSAKYPGTFGNRLYVQFKKRSKSNCIFNIIVYTRDSSGVKTILENNVCTFDVEEATDFVPYYREIESQFIKPIPYISGITKTTHIGIVGSDNTLQIESFMNGTDREYGDKGAIPKSDFAGNINATGISGTSNEVTVYSGSHKPDKADNRTKYIIYVDSGNNAEGHYVVDTAGKWKKLTNAEDIIEYTNNGTLHVPVTKTAITDGSTTEVLFNTKTITPSTAVGTSNVGLIVYNEKDKKYYIIANDNGTAKWQVYTDDTYLISNKELGAKAFKLALARYAAAIDASDQEGYRFDATSPGFYSYNGDVRDIDETNTTTVRYLATIYNNVGKPTVEDGQVTPSGDEPLWSQDKLLNVQYREWLFTACTGISYYKQNVNAYETTNFDTGVYGLLKDKLKYNAQRVISPGWDDQDLLYLDDVLYADDIIDDKDPVGFNFISPIHVRLMDVGYWARCTAALLDIPRSVSRCKVYVDNELSTGIGYAQKLARTAIYGELFDASVTDVGLYPTHSALFAPWGQYKYAKLAKMNIASPAFLALMIHISQIKGQADQYEWILPRNRQHTLNIGKMDYIVPKKLMDLWQSLDGVGVNIITDIPGLGTNLWGNSTLYEVPEATYQALANLSTRYLVNAIENQAYNAGIGITYTYNNNQAYEQFYAGVTPLLDTMKNLQAITDYYVKMEADINGLDRVNANTVLGKIYITPVGVINDIVVDLVALPPSVSLDEIRAE